MKLFTAVLMAALMAVTLTQETTEIPDVTTTTDSQTTTTTPTTTTSTTPSSTTTANSTTTSTTTTSTTTSTTSTTTTPKPTTTSTTPKPTTTSTTTVAPPKPAEPTLGNFTLMSKGKVYAYVLMKVVVTQNSTRIPLVNPVLDESASRCADDTVVLFIKAKDAANLEVTIKHDKTNYYINEISVDTSTGVAASRGNLTQFSTPLSQFYKCSADSEVSLEEQDVKVIFSGMKYQAFSKSKEAKFVGSQLECVSDNHSDVAIIAVGCALALLVVVILVAYLIARRKNRQRGYQSV